MKLPFINKKINKIDFIGHCLLAQIPPFVFYVLFSFIGFSVIDAAFPVVISNLIRSGLIPCKDFFNFIFPFSFYIQVFLQKLFFFLPSIIISRLWKGLISISLCFVFLVYIRALLRRFDIKDKIPISFIYIFALFFMFVGPIHETFSFYTFDALFFGCLGILLVAWPDHNENNIWICLLGYLFLGLAVCCKQDIGVAVLFVGIVFVFANYIIKRSALKKNNFFLEILLPLFFLFAPLVSMFLYFYSKGALSDFWFQLFVYPSYIKISIQSFVFSVLSLRLVGLTNWAILVISLIIFIVSLFWIVGLRKKESLVYRGLLYFLALSLIIFSFYLLFFVASNVRFVRILFLGMLSDRFPLKTTILRSVVYVFLSCTYFTFLALLVSVFKNKMWKNRFFILYYVLPVSCFLLLFLFSSMAGINCGRLLKNSFPLVISFFMVLLLFMKRKNIFNFSWRAINGSLLILCLFLFILRFRAISGDVYVFPLRRQMSYCNQLHCFLDSEFYQEMIKIRRVVNTYKEPRVFAYNVDPFFYLFLNKNPVSFSVVHLSDTFHRFMYRKEIKRIEEKVNLVVISKKGHKNDMIMDYINSNYKLIFVGSFFCVAVRRAENGG
ncbi:hypothetical protein HN446_02125 [bacterium]|nr:hypothetical protein [bacterium]